VKFYRLSRRLFCDIYQINRLLSTVPPIDALFNGKKGQFFIEDEQFQIEIVYVDRYRQVIWKVTSNLDPIPFNIHFYLMQAGEKTKSCIDLQGILTHPSLNEITQKSETNKQIEVSQFILECIHKKFNKDWVITDAELGSSRLR